MKMFILGFLACYVLASLLFFLFDEYDVEVIDLFIKPWCVLAIVVSFVFIWIYKIFRHLVYGVEQKNVDLTLKSAEKYKNLHLFGPVWFYVDYEARALVNKFFFYRIKKT